MEALAKANKTRRERAQVKRDIGQGKTTVSHILTICPEACQTMTILELFSSQQRWGRVRTDKFLKSLTGFPYNLKLSNSRKLFELTIRERKSILLALDDRARKR